MTTPAPTLTPTFQTAAQARAAGVCQREYKGCTHTDDHIEPAMSTPAFNAVLRDANYYDNWVAACNNCYNIDQLLNSTTHPVDSLVTSVLNVASGLVTTFLGQLHTFFNDFLPGPTSYVQQAIAILKQLEGGS